MTARELAHDVLRLLGSIQGGSMQVSLNGAPLVRMDGDRRDLAIQLQPLVGMRGPARAWLRQSHLNLWEARGIPSALARAGWRVSVQEGSEELVRLGRDVSALTGHVHVSLAALRKLGGAA